MSVRVVIKVDNMGRSLSIESQLDDPATFAVVTSAWIELLSKKVRFEVREEIKEQERRIIG